MTGCLVCTVESAPDDSEVRGRWTIVAFAAGLTHALEALAGDGQPSGFCDRHQRLLDGCLAHMQGVIDERERRYVEFEMLSRLEGAKNP